MDRISFEFKQKMFWVKYFKDPFQDVTVHTFLVEDEELKSIVGEVFTGITENSNPIKPLTFPKEERSKEENEIRKAICLAVANRKPQ